MAKTLARRAPAVTGTFVSIPVEFPRVLTLRSRNIKRTLDLAVGIAIALATLPLVGLIALAVFLESGGPIFFKHERIGRGNRRFRVWKFRTMVVDGEHLLARHLALNPEAASEWELTHKLRQDPRVTRMGRLLRRSSMDELPQLWNVLRGDMSLVGPRPIVSEEIPKYGSAFRLYSQVAPGLTGLWQVSGRNDTSYRRRVELDTRYIRHWTPALDLQVLARTVLVVVAGKGAY